LARHARGRSIYVAWQRAPKTRLALALTAPMLPNKPRGIWRVDDRRARDASFGSCVQVHHGATCRRPMVLHDVLQSLRSVDDGVVALICPTCQPSTSVTRRVPATVHGVVFNILAGRTAEAPPCPSAASGRLRHPTSEEATARALEPSPYLSSAFSIFTNSPCTYSFPHSTCPVFSGSSLPSMPEIVPPASASM
jgi:hypothetical protein